MRNTVIGLVLAVVLLGGLFFAATHRAHRAPALPAANPQAIRAAADSIRAGFVGRKQIGAWRLACADKPVMVTAGNSVAADSAPAASAPIPLSLDGKTKRKAGAAAGQAKAAGSPGAEPAGKVEAKKVSLGRCRVIMEFRRKAAPKQIVLTIAFRRVGAKQDKLGLFVRTVAARKGQTLVLRLGKAGFKLPVAGCARAGCLAIGILAPGSERDFALAEAGTLILPPGKDGKRRALRVPFSGLPAALAALRRAQS